MNIRTAIVIIGKKRKRILKMGFLLQKKMIIRYNNILKLSFSIEEKKKQMKSKCWKEVVRGMK